MSLDKDFLGKFKQNSLRPGERDAVESAAQRTENREGRTIDRSDTAGLIQNYLHRFVEIFHRPDSTKRERGIVQLKRILHDEFVIKPDAIPASYYTSIERRHREEGHGDIDILNALKAELGQTLMDDQTRSLDAWIDYLSSDDAKYPDELKYWSFRSILKMGRYDKEKKRFGNREGRGTVSPFPELNREALAFVVDAMEKKYRGEAPRFPYDITDDAQGAFSDMLQKEQFHKLYAWAIDHINPVPENLKQTTEGAWFTFPKGSDPMTHVPIGMLKGRKIEGKPLVPSIENYATGWCLRGEATARRYLETSELQVFYSLDEQGYPRIPRVVTVRNDRGLAEVRGIAQQENLDSHITPVVQEKLKEFPDGAAFGKKTNDMKLLTAVEYKTDAGEALSKDDLLFLYEINDTIEGFGYQKDPRIGEIRSKRNPEADMLIVFECAKDQIARSPREINEHTKAYVGSLQEGLFDALPDHLEHIYTSFPEGRIRLESLQIGGLTAEELEAALIREKINIGDYARRMLRNKKQFIEPVNTRHRERKGSKEAVDLVHLHVRDLGFTSAPTTTELFKRALKLGLELCHLETGPYKRLADKDQPLGNWYYVGMEPVAASGGDPHVFSLAHGEGGLWLHNHWALPGNQWNLGHEFIFRRRKSVA